MPSWRGRGTIPPFVWNWRPTTAIREADLDGTPLTAPDVTWTARGGGVGETLTAEAIRLAYACGARTLDLTSRPAREAAHRLYSKLGFQVRDTSVYRHQQQR